MRKDQKNSLEISITRDEAPQFGGALDFYLEIYSKREEEEREEKEKKRAEETAKLKQAIKEVKDYNRDAYFEVNKLGELKKIKAFKVRFKDHASLFFIAFTTRADKARAMAQRYMRDTYYPTHTINGCPISLQETRANRVKEFDKYKETGKIPIPALMKYGIGFSCSACGKFNFNYEDYKNNRCYIVEGEGDLNPFTKGYLFCHSCYHKYFN